MADFAPGTRTINVAVANAEGIVLPGVTPTAPVSYTASSGTLTVSADTFSATLDNAAIGSVTVSVTDAAGLTGSATFNVADGTPHQLVVTVS